MIKDLDVYRVISEEAIVICSITNDDATLFQDIMGKNEIQISIVTDYIPVIEVGDFIEFEGVKYKLNRESEFVDKSSVQHETTYTFESPEYTLIDKILLNKISHSTKVTLTGKLRDWLELLIWNVNVSSENSLGVDTGWKLGDIPDTDYKTLTFDGIDCRSLLSELASAYEYEYWVNDHTINYVSRIENERGLTFVQGRGKGLYEIEQTNIDDGDITTRVYPVGGTENIIPGEGDEEGRLILPEKYLENFSEISRVVEKKVVFEGIHPTFTGIVNNPGGDNKRTFSCPKIDFDINKLAVGDEARINFLTGDLMGKSFEFQWKNDGKQITLLYQEDDLASIDPETQTRPSIPSDAKYLRGGEEFNFTGIRLGESYKNTAITLLRDKATDWLNYHSQKRVKFALSVDNRYMRGKGDLKPGDLITIIIPERNIEKLIRITSIDKSLHNNQTTCTVSNYLTEKWEDKIQGELSSMQATVNGGGGGTGNVTIVEKYDERPLNDKNVLSSVRALKEIADNNEVFKKLFLRKDQPDFTNYLLEALGGLNVGDAIDSMTAGQGIIADILGRLQVGRLEVRDSLTVQELIFNRQSAMESDYSFSEAGTIESVELLEDGTYRLPLRKQWENDFTGLSENDVVFGNVNNLASGRGDSYTSWLRVLNVNTVANSVIAVMYPDDEVPGGKNYPPEPLMILSHRGNPINEDRQSWWYISSREKCICMLDGVVKPILDEKNYAVIIGKLKQLSIFDNLPINYLHSYIYCRGIAIQDLLRIDYQGIPVRSENNRGKWSAIEATEIPYQSTEASYDSVYHAGCKWMCLSTGTTQEPKWNSTDWAQIEGNSELTLEFTSSNGYNFFAGKVNTEITPYVYWGYNDISDDILPADWAWTRDSGQVTEDNAWSVTHANNGRILHLTNEDMPSNWGATRKVKFTCTAYVRDGIEFNNVKNSITV